MGMAEVVKIFGYRSPVGDMVVGALDERLCICDWDYANRRVETFSRICRWHNVKYEEGLSEVINRAITELDEYFAGKRREFLVPLVFSGTDFQRSVWTELLKIPYGSTISYSELARRIDKPNAVRAVASAVAANPMSIFVPCHRIVGSDHKLTGYAGGLEVKQGLLTLEERYRDI